ncbi:DgyrCDS9700 [Dimorphilus gyrociliatus]|uniref:DgyrCDS9700 n=1 Tax=Dimorphilus gyrociliatus TaxID=2664684 RepID=A0A7I8VXS7_9ANNE|nr:DgyrCDS9700 [Dimorphilus gyrociliatus]
MSEKTKLTIFIFITTILSIVFGQRIYWKCTFENDDCSFQSNVPDQFQVYKFERGNLKTPERAENCMYARKTNSHLEEAYLFSSKLNIPRNIGKLCFKFNILMSNGQDELFVFFLKDYQIVKQRAFSMKYSHEIFKWIEKTDYLSQSVDEIMIKSSRKNSATSIIAIDNMEFNDCYADSSSTPPSSTNIDSILQCNFDSSTTCQYELLRSSQNRIDNYAWTVSNPQHSFYGLPEQDVSKNGYYLHSGPFVCWEGDRVYLKSSSIIVTNPRCKLSFYYHMSGENVGTLTVYTNNKENLQQVLVEKRGPQGESWLTEDISLPIGEYELIFEGKCTILSLSHIAVDEITTHNCQSPSLSTPRPTPNRNSPTLLECRFEQDFCNYYQSTQTHQWVIGRETPSSNTGPQVPYSGNFVYFEATTATRGYFSLLESPVVYFDKETCLSFMYNMHGSHIGRFLVSLITLDQNENRIIGNETILNEIGNKGTDWIRFSHTINDYPQIRPRKLNFYAFYGRGYKGDVSFDEVTISYGSCPGSARSTRETSSVTVRPGPSPKLLECQFEQDFCNYYQNSTNYQWLIGRETPSRDTGPQAPYSGNFVYFEATTATRGYFSLLESPIVYFDKETCLSFMYNMYGSHTGRFLVSLITFDQTDSRIIRNETILNEIGNKGMEWIRFSYTIRNSPQIAHIKLNFMGLYGRGYRGDISFDGIQINDGSCLV